MGLERGWGGKCADSTRIGIRARWKWEWKWKWRWNGRWSIGALRATIDRRIQYPRRRLDQLGTFYLNLTPPLELEKGVSLFAYLPMLSFANCHIRLVNFSTPEPIAMPSLK